MQWSADTSSSSHEPPTMPRPYVEPGSGKHSVFTHFLEDPNCEICLKTKITGASCRRRANAVMPRAENLGDLITADHKFFVKEVNHATIIDTPLWYKIWQLSDCSPSMKFLEPTRKPKVSDTDNSLEFGKSCEELSWNHCTSTPHR